MSKVLFKNCYYLIIRMVIPNKSDSAVIEALRKRGYKATPQRIAVCRVALSSRGHLSAQQVYAEVKEIHPTLSLATVYKTLRILRDLGLVQELNFPKGQARFDSYMKPHINLVCTKCGSISDLDNHIIDEIIKKVASAARFKPYGQRVDVYGICQKCLEKKH